VLQELYSAGRPGVENLNADTERREKLIQKYLRRQKLLNPPGESSDVRDLTLPDDEIFPI
jgi:hypothetical protein